MPVMSQCSRQRWIETPIGVFRYTTWAIHSSAEWRDPSAILVMVRAQLVDAVAHGFSNAKPSEEPVVGVPSAVVDRAAVATVVIAVAARWGGRPLGHVLRPRRPGRGAVGGHLDWTGGVLIKVRRVRVAARNFLRLRKARRVLPRAIALWDVDRGGRLGAAPQNSRGNGVGCLARVFLLLGVTATGRRSSSGSLGW